MKRTFFARRALAILCVIFFLVPFALRGARMSLERMENNVKDWLPDSFEETKELTWFAKHFVGEQSFILLTWEGCSAPDESFRVYVDKLRNEVMPPENSQAASDTPPADLKGDQLRSWERAHEIARGRKTGDELGLYTTGNYFQNWGQRDEKWLRGNDDCWYYITPNGELYRWAGRSNVLGAMSRLFQRHVLGHTMVQGEHIATFGRPPSRKNRNDFHDDPRNLTAHVLKSVTTGPDVLNELARPGGPMWPIGTAYSDEQRPIVARRRALERLKGALYGPEPFQSFQWTADDLPRVLHPAQMAALPDDWQTKVDAYIKQLVTEKFAGERAPLLAASLTDKESYWDAMYHAMGIDPPGLQTCIMVTLSKPGMQDLRRVIGRGLLGRPRGKLVDLAVESGVLPPTKPPMMPFVPHVAATGKVLRMGGPPVDNVAIDEEGQITLVRLVGFSAVIGLGLAFICFRSVKITLMIFMVGGISAVTSLSIVWWTGSSVDAILMSMPSLVYVLGLSGAVHIVNYYREAVHDGGVAGAPERALKHGLMPCTLAAFTTALGLISLYQSNIFPIRKFGLFSAIGVMATLTLLFTYLPSALELWPPGYDHERHKKGNSVWHDRIHAFWQAVGGWIVDHHWWVSASAIVIMVTVGLGIAKLNTSIQLLKLFDPGAKIIRDYRWLEASVGKIVPMELIVGVDPKLQYHRPASTATNAVPADQESIADRNREKYEYSFLERFELVSHIQNAVEDVFGMQGQDIVGRALSAATFAPPVMDPIDRERLTVNRKLEQNRDRYLQDQYLAMDDDDSELWRISVRLGALNDVDYGQFVAQLKRVVEPVVTAYETRDNVLRAIEQQRDSGGYNPPGIWNQSRIAILGAADPFAPKTTPAATDKSRQDPDEATGHTANPEDIHRVFAHVLGDLLRAKGFQGRKGRRIPSRYLAWNDADAVPIPDPRSEKWAKMLSQFDCVVIVKDHPDYDLDFIKKHAKAVVDARDHLFAPGTSQTAKQRHEPLAVTYTGVVPIVYKAQRTLLHSLINSIGWAFIMISAVMMILLRNRRRQLLNPAGGLVAMIPNIFPVVLIFGAMGHMNILVDIGTMMTASVAMGVAVDDTIHFLTWFRDGIRNGLERHVAIKEAYGRVALAMTQTTLIGGLGLSVFAMSTFTPTQRFGTMMLTLLAAALVGDLVILPALLAGPLGRYICPEVTPKPTDQHDGEAATSDGTVPEGLPIDRQASAPVGPMHGRPRSGKAHTSNWIRDDAAHDGQRLP